MFNLIVLLILGIFSPLEEPAIYVDIIEENWTIGDKYPTIIMWTYECDGYDHMNSFHFWCEPPVIHKGGSCSLRVYYDGQFILFKSNEYRLTITDFDRIQDVIKGDKERSGYEYFPYDPPIYTVIK